MDSEYTNFLLISDTHYGSLWDQVENVEKAFDLCSEYNIKHVIHAGDFTDGWNMRPTHMRDVKTFSVDDLIEYSIDVHPRRPGVTTHVCAGNHDRTTMTKEILGVDILRNISRCRNDINYVTSDTPIFTLQGTSFYLTHGTGRSGVTKSLNIQRCCERAMKWCTAKDLSFPDVVCCGHLHCSVELPDHYGMYGIQIPSLQGQTNHFNDIGLIGEIGCIVLSVPKDGGIPRKTPYKFKEIIN